MFPTIFYKIRRLEEEFYRRIFKRKLIQFDGFASHIPILIGLTNVLKPKTILELGPGLYSTKLFLNESSLPNLIKFVCLESDYEWLEKVKPLFNQSTNHQLLYTSGKVSSYVKKIDDFFDLVFIDDSYTLDDRAESIKNISESASLNKALIVIHDYEETKYQIASEKFSNRYIFRCFYPRIGVVWNGNIMKISDLRTIENKIYSKKWKYSVTDIEKWTNYLKN